MTTTAIPRPAAATDAGEDAALIASVRSGATNAYGSLYQRHVAAAHSQARQLARCPADAEDLVAEAFAKVLDTLLAGGGPDSFFRAYLLTALRHVAYDKTRRGSRLELTGDIATAGVRTERISEPFLDIAERDLDRLLAARAFARLPERWQTVLWHTVIAGRSPAEVAPLLGLTPNRVSVLKCQAREGLRQAYLRVYLMQPAPPRCRYTVDRLGAWHRHALCPTVAAQVRTHLDACDGCRARLAEFPTELRKPQPTRPSRCRGRTR